MGIVLVHGGGFGASCWDLLVPELRTPAIAVDLPGRGNRPADLRTTTVEDFTDAVVEVIEGSGWERVVLVGHSLAGITVPRVAARIPERLARLVFVACVVPRPGDACLDTFDAATRAHALERFHESDWVAQPTPADRVKVIFGNDLDDEQFAWMLERMVPEAGRVMCAPSDLTGLANPIPRSWVRLLRDAIVPVAVQDASITTMGGADVVDLDAAHMAMISRPAELATILDDLAARSLG